MKLLFDQNISHRILSLLPEQFRDASSIKKEGLTNASDFEIWEYAKTNNFIIVTQDSDFNDLSLIYGTPPKVIWLRLGNLKTPQIVEILNRKNAEIQEFLSNEYGCFEILSPKYIKL